MVASRSFASINHGCKKFVSGQFFCLISIFEILQNICLCRLGIVIFFHTFHYNGKVHVRSVSFLTSFAKSILGFANGLLSHSSPIWQLVAELLMLVICKKCEYIESIIQHKYKWSQIVQDRCSCGIHNNAHDIYIYYISSIHILVLYIPSSFHIIPLVILPMQ